jgi:hypothetical protein
MPSTLTRTAAAFAVAALPLIAGATTAQAGGRPSDPHQNYCKDKKKDGRDTYRSSASRDQCAPPDRKPPSRPPTTDPNKDHRDHRDHRDHKGSYDPARYKDKKHDPRDDHKRGDHKRHDNRKHDDRYRHHHHKRDHRVTVDPYNEVRTATARYFSVPAAERDGYARPASGPLRGCIAKVVGSTAAPAMGFHWINMKLVDATVDATKPEALVYEPNKDGKLDFVAVEYVVPKDAWEKAGNLRPPKLFGVEFMLTTAPNRYQIPAFYSLHAWIWKSNPDGINEPFNPRVSCTYASLIK